MKNKGILARIIYESFARYLPKSQTKLFGKLSNFIRSRLVSKYIISSGKNITIEKGAVIGNGVKIGNNSGIGVYAKIPSGVEIGSDVMMGPYCKIYTQNHNFKDLTKPIRVQGYLPRENVFISDDVWIGGHVIILPGVKIGKGSIIGAGSVVTKNFPDYSIIGGNPARVIKNRREIE